ncbi:hypothetical protein MNBD_GAMMA26-342 [hydrothermal vent metagenome]|uniref:mRNA interferase YafQ n=1 Tax=hydrothermal vent metagenome TaxID=652676 RepID=A0A3B1BCA9_9ZZZZ
MRITDTQATKLFLYITMLLKNEALPKIARDHSLQGEWIDFREFHIGGDTLVIYKTNDQNVYLARVGSHAQLFK